MSMQDMQNPYPGLRLFTADDAHLFFGREQQVDVMVDTLASTGLLAVLGSSGSGKSSLVNCGLLPALQLGRIHQASTDWRMAVMRPGSNPIGNLAQALALALAPNDGADAADLDHGLVRAEMLETDLRASSLGLVDVYRQALPDGHTNLLVVVDQLEELFRYRSLTTSWEDDAAALISLLLEARQRPGCAIHLVLTLRSDFLGECEQFRGLADAIGAGIFLMPRMGRGERRSAISGPAAVAGVTLSPVLLNRLLNDTGDAPAQLPLLQHALRRTWARWQKDGGEAGDMLDLAPYEAIGGCGQALDRHAEAVYSALRSDAAQALCAQVFKSLVDRVTDPRGVRRPTRFGDLCQAAGADADAVAAAVAPFRAPDCGFLLPPLDQTLQADTVLDLSHESLMRGWARLNRWVDEEAQSARSYRRLAETAELHTRGQAGLLQDPDLKQALDWRARQQPTPAWAARWYPGAETFEMAMAFLEHSQRAQDAETAKLALQRSRRPWLLLISLAVGGMLGYVLGIWGRG